MPLYLSTLVDAWMRETVHAQHGEPEDTHLDAKKRLSQPLLWELSFPLSSQIRKAGTITIGQAAPKAD